MKGRYYDLNRFDHDIPIREVMQLMGQEITKKGLVPCPSAEHKDKHPSAKIYDNNNICYCFACNRRFGPLDIVSEKLGLGWREACDYLIENMNCQGFYLDPDGEHTTEETFPLTSRDMKLLSLSASREGDLSLFDLWKNERGLFNDIVYGKASEAVTKVLTGLKAAEDNRRFGLAERERYLSACGYAPERIEDLRSAWYSHLHITLDDNSDEYKALYYDSWVKAVEEDIKQLRSEFSRLKDIKEYTIDTPEHDEIEVDR